jgi:hypothetical protein
MTKILKSKKCNVCGSSSLETVFEAPSLPLTGLYILDGDTYEPPCFDQSLLFCLNCGHGQLGYLIETKLIYDKSYTHRTSTSQIAKAGNDFFYNTLKQLLHGRNIKSVLEVGCNDLYLLKKIQELNFDSILGIDPVWRDKDHDLSPSTQVMGLFVEELEFGKNINIRPDLIISAHTFEHVHDFYKQMELLVRLASEEALFVIEVPCFESLIKTKRFDQVFHQHIQYTSIASMHRLIDRLGCSYLGHVINYSYWGGTLLFWFEKKSKLKSVCFEYSVIDFSIIKKSYQDFSMSMINLNNQLSNIDEEIFGFGAAQMLPILAYHMKSKLEMMSAILDDNIERINTRLPSIAPIIRLPNVEEVRDASVVITALDSSRPIIKRLLELNPRRIIIPMSIM